MTPTAGPAPDGVTWAPPDPREVFTVSPDGRIAPLLPSVPSADQQLRSELAAAQRQIRLLTTELDTLKRDHQALKRAAGDLCDRVLQLQRIHHSMQSAFQVKALEPLLAASGAFDDLLTDEDFAGPAPVTWQQADELASAATSLP